MRRLQKAYSVPGKATTRRPYKISSQTVHAGNIYQDLTHLEYTRFFLFLLVPARIVGAWDGSQGPRRNVRGSSKEAASKPTVAKKKSGGLRGGVRNLPVPGEGRPRRRPGLVSMSLADFCQGMLGLQLFANQWVFH